MGACWLGPDSDHKANLPESYSATVNLMLAVATGVYYQGSAHKREWVKAGWGYSLRFRDQLCLSLLLSQRSSGYV